MKPNSTPKATPSQRLMIFVCVFISIVALWEGVLHTLGMPTHPHMLEYTKWLFGACFMADKCYDAYCKNKEWEHKYDGKQEG